jgi:hypothetical protein
MRRVHHAFRLGPTLALVALLLVVVANTARASFHLIEVNKVLPSYNGDTAIQAIELRMQAGGQNFVSGLRIQTYNAAGSPVATLGTFSANLPAAGAVADRRILCATTGFATQFGITPDLVISAGVPAGTGQASFEIPGCLVNAVAYGDVTSPVNGTTSAPAIPVGLAYVLSRKVNNGTIQSCPLAEDAAARFGVVSGSSAAPVPFSNNAGATVNVFSTLVAADGPPSQPAWRVYPNPFGAALRIEAPGVGPVAVFDVRGALVRQLRSGDEPTSGSQRLTWDGRNVRGERAPAGVYFVRFGRGPSPLVTRVALLR